MSNNKLNMQTRDLASHLLDNAWFTDGGRLFVKREVFDQVPGFGSAEIALNKAAKYYFIAEDSANGDKIFLRKDILEREARRDFVIDPARTEFSDPDKQVALKLLHISRMDIRFVGGTREYCIDPEVLNDLDPEGRALKNGWIAPKHPATTGAQALLDDSTAIFRGGKHTVDFRKIKEVLCIGKAQSYIRY